MTINKSQPNIVFFFTDQQRWDTTGTSGNPLDLTPNFDRMARYGTHLANTITPQPVCGPCRSVIQTGMYATENGCYRNTIKLDPQFSTLAHHFNDAGYETGYIGKWHLADTDSFGAVDESQRGGYKYWLAANLLEFVSDAYDTRLYDNNNNELRLPGYRVDAMTDAAIRYIDSVKDNPFFLFLSFLEPHHQNHLDSYPAPDGYEEKYRAKWTPPDLADLGGSAQMHLPGYYGMIRRLDEALGRLMDALKSMDLIDNTIVVFTSDHGNHFKTRNAEYKRSCHESSVHVPCAIQGPGFNGRGEVNHMVSLVDLPPTLLDVAGIEIPEVMQGHSIMPIINDLNADWQDDVFIQISESQVARAIRTNQWKYCVVADNADPWHDAYSDTYREAYLYDLSVDPYELHNLITYESHIPIAEDMRKRLLDRINNIEGRTPTILVPDEYVQYGQLSGSSEFPYIYSKLNKLR